MKLTLFFVTLLCGRRIKGVPKLTVESTAVFSMKSSLSYCPQLSSKNGSEDLDYYYCTGWDVDDNWQWVEDWGLRCWRNGTRGTRTRKLNQELGKKSRRKNRNEMKCGCKNREGTASSLSLPSSSLLCCAVLCCHLPSSHHCYSALLYYYIRL